VLIQAEGKVNIGWSQAPGKAACAYSGIGELSLDSPEANGGKPEETGAKGE
jgi:hypothetical protein